MKPVRIVAVAVVALVVCACSLRISSRSEDIEDAECRLIFNGKDLAGWTTEEGAWKVDQGSLISAGNAPLVSEPEFKRFELMFEWRLSEKSKADMDCSVGTVEGGIATVSFRHNRIQCGWRKEPIGSTGSRPHDRVMSGIWNRTTLIVSDKLELFLNDERVSYLPDDRITVSGPITFQPL